MNAILDSITSGEAFLPESLLNEIGPMAFAYAMLAAATLPLCVILRWLVNRDLPRQRLFRPTTIDVLAFTLLALAMPALYQASYDVLARLGAWPFQARTGTPQVVALVVWLVTLLLWLNRCGHDPCRAFRSMRWCKDLAAGIIAFIVLTPVTFAVFWLASAILSIFGIPVDQHPLTEYDVSTPTGVAIFISLACVVAPIIEESIFRGLLLPWARERRWRPWLIFALAVVMLLAARNLTHLDAVFFLIDLSAIMAFAAFGRQIWKKWPSRTASSIFATAALFGTMHAAVWPSPIPLTVLGVGLGMLTIRTGSVRPAIVAHSLFNAVSVIYVLRGGS